MLPAILLSGFLFQIRSMPEWLQVVTYAVPARYYLVILRGVILKGTGLAPYWDQMLALVVFAVVMVTLASVPNIVNLGGERYAGMGVHRSKGTLAFQLAGNIKRGGVVEKAFGLNGGHASGSGGSHGLAVVMVCNVAGREDALHAGLEPGWGTI